MTTPGEFIGMASAAVVGSMGTELWQYTRESCRALFRRHTPDRAAVTLRRLDAYEQAVAAAPPDERDAAAADFESDVTGWLGELAAVSAEAAEEVRALPGKLREAPAAGVSNSNVTIKNVKAKGDFIWTGRDSYTNGRKRA